MVFGGGGGEESGFVATERRYTRFSILLNKGLKALTQSCEPLVPFILWIDFKTCR
jgi:hypothetical protein